MVAIKFLNIPLGQGFVDQFKGLEERNLTNGLISGSSQVYTTLSRNFYFFIRVDVIYFNC